MTADERPLPFETAVNRVGGVTVLSVRGEVDLSTAPQLKVAIDAVLSGQGGVSLIVDLTEVPFYASAGMTLLIGAAARAAQVGRFAVVADGPHTARRMLLLGLGDTFEIHPDLDTAVAALTG